MQIDERDSQCEKADSGIDASLEPDSNVTVARDRHTWKHFLPSVSTVEGMQIDEREEQWENEYLSIQQSLEPGSNITVEMDSQ
jgi:hypothetical protein